MFRSALIVLSVVIWASAPTWGFGTKKTAASEPASGISPSASPIWVAKADGSKSCGAKAGASLEAMSAPLKKLGIRVLQSVKAHDGMMHTQVCGASTGMLNAYQVSSKDLEKAKGAGFFEYRFPEKGAN